MRSLIFKILNKLYPLRDMDADLDMNKFHIVGDYIVLGMCEVKKLDSPVGIEEKS